MHAGRSFIALFAITIGTSFIVTTAKGAQWDKQTASHYRLPDPPDSNASRLEIEEMLQFQNERTDAECELGQKERWAEFSSLFSGKAFLTAHDVKTLSPLMNRVTKLGDKIAHHFKNRYKRTRPYDFDARVHPCVTVPGGQTSYPSSHATIATLDACVLALVFNDAKSQSALVKLSKALSERRTRIGVHFPSDVAAGEALGTMICHTLTGDSEFKLEVEAMQQAL